MHSFITETYIINIELALFVFSGVFDVMYFSFPFKSALSNSWCLYDVHCMLCYSYTSNEMPLYFIFIF